MTALRLAPAVAARSTRWLLPVLAGLLVVVSACGRKTPPRPPELLRPMAIEDLSAANAVDGILLQWKRPSKYVDGTRLTDLGGFRIERSRDDGSFEALATLQVHDRDRFRQPHTFRYHDMSAVIGERYRYRVTSFTTDDYQSAPSNIADCERTAAPRPTTTPAT